MKNIDNQEVKRRYLAGESTAEISKCHNVTPGTIHYRLKKMGVHIRSRSETIDLKNRQKLEAYKTIEKYLNGKPLIKIQAELGVGYNSIRRYIQSKGIQLREHGEVSIQNHKVRKEKNGEPSIDKLIELYKSGMDFKDISNIFQINKSTIRYRIMKTGIKIRSTSESVQLKNTIIFDGFQADEKYIAGMSMLSIQKKTGKSYKAVIRYLSDRGIPIRNRAQANTCWHRIKRSRPRKKSTFEISVTPPVVFNPKFMSLIHHVEFFLKTHPDKTDLDIARACGTSTKFVSSHRKFLKSLP